MQSKQNNITTLDQLSTVAKDFARQINAKSFCVVTLQGDLAAGKTTFVQEVAKYLGIKEHVQSPTYALQRTYPLSTPAQQFHHLDLYRLGNFEHVESLGITDLFYEGKGLYFIEWPEVLEPLLETLQIKPIRLKLYMEGEKRLLTINEVDFFN